MFEMLLLCALLLAQQNDEQSSSSDDTDSEETQITSRRRQESSTNRVGQTAVARKSERVSLKKPSVVKNKANVVRNTIKRHNNSDNSSEEQILKKPKTEPTFLNTDNNLHNTNSTNDVNTRESTDDCCSVIIAHKDYPKIKLSTREIRKIKENLLAEIDKTENIGANLGFLSCVLEDGWLLLNCQNTGTRDWVMNIINKLNTTLKMDLKATNSITLPPKTFICSLNIPSEDVMSPDALRYRLAKQNVDLLTEEWCFLNVVKSEEGGECVTYRIDEKSKYVIEARGYKLFLNFSQISVQTLPN
uniref:DUF4780 domain-containing protein n=2 Tax=Bactrocera latifrons TaxID=174628 RepID=A0A0K8W016_BACLA